MSRLTLLSSALRQVTRDFGTLNGTITLQSVTASSHGVLHTQRVTTTIASVLDSPLVSSSTSNVIGIAKAFTAPVKREERLERKASGGDEVAGDTDDTIEGGAIGGVEGGMPGKKLDSIEE